MEGLVIQVSKNIERGDAEFLEVFLHCLVNCQIVNEHAKLDKGYCRKRTEIIIIFIISVL